MIKAYLDCQFKRITIEMNESMQKLLSDGLTDCLAITRSYEDEKKAGMLEILELLRYRIKDALQNNAYSFIVSIIEGFFTAQILHEVTSDITISKSIDNTKKDGIQELARTINYVIFEFIPKRYMTMPHERHHQVNLIYIQYLDYMFDNQAGQMSNDKRIEFFTAMLNQLNDHASKPNERSNIGILPFPEFYSLCKQWMQINHQTDICLEEIINNNLFIQNDDE